MKQNWIENSLSRLESRLRGLIEGESIRNPVPQTLHDHLAKILVQGMQSGVKKEPGWKDTSGPVVIAPDQYTLIVPLELAKTLQANPSELDELSDHLTRAAAAAKFFFPGLPLIRIVGDPYAREIHLRMEFSHRKVGDSFTTKLDEKFITHGASSNGLMPGAFLIVNGLSTYPIIQPITNIGSDQTNQLVIKDPSVSSTHAQLRFLGNRFVLFDLDSKGGTYVNGRAISNLAINPGDVILLADVPLVFGHDTSHQLGNTRELPANPPSIEILHG